MKNKGIKVLFLYPNTFGMNMLPPAIALFSAILKKEGHQVELFDTTYYSVDHDMDSDNRKMEKGQIVPYNMASRGIKMHTTDWKDDLKKKVDQYQPDLLALSCTEDMWPLGLKILREVKDYKKDNNIPVIAGGVFSTFAPEIVIKEELIDIVCKGEGENVLVDLCKKIQNKEDYSDLSNCWIKKDGEIIKKNPISNPVDVDANPMIDISLFEENRLYRPMGGTIYKMFPVETIRGCPYKCRYCNSPDQDRFYRNETGKSFFRKRRLDLVEKDLYHFKHNLGAEYLYFWADTFLAISKKEFEEFCEMYSKIKLPFWIETRPETVNDYNISKLSAVGLDRISFGVEHGNEEFRKKVLGRLWKNEDIIKALKVPHKYGVKFSVNNITGFPYETKKLAFDTIELNRHIVSDNQNIFTFVPFHGTPLRKTVEDLGLMKPETITTTCTTDDTQLVMPQYTPQEIKEVIRTFNMYVKFPRNRWKDIKKAEQTDAEGEKIYQELKQEFLEKYMPKKNADPRNAAKDFIFHAKSIDLAKNPHVDEMK